MTEFLSCSSNKNNDRNGNSLEITYLVILAFWIFFFNFMQAESVDKKPW